jgi:hypothetical protein
MARKVGEVANFVFVHLTEQEPGIYDKRHPDYARQDKTDFAWESISDDKKGVWIQVKIFPNNISESG